MAGAGMAVGTTVTKVIAEVMARDVRGEVEEKISQDQGNSYFPVLFLVFFIDLFSDYPTVQRCGVWSLRLNFLLIWWRRVAAIRPGL